MRELFIRVCPKCKEDYGINKPCRCQRFWLKIQIVAGLVFAGVLLYFIVRGKI